jgi:hypothetical protein
VIIGDKNEGVLTKRRLARESEKVNLCLLSKVEPKKFVDPIKDDGSIKGNGRRIRPNRK